jgi:WD40 repeat-containing protein SMU1
MAAIEPADVVRLIEQYLKENNLFKTLQTLQDETSVSLNTVDSVETFVNDINSGHWDVVLRIVKVLKLPDNKLMDLYEQIAIELIEQRETRAAKWLIQKTEPIAKLKDHKPERYIHLQNLLTRTSFDPMDAYRGGSSKEQRRAAIANELKKEVTVVPPQRLLNLISDALKWQKHEGLLPSSTVIDIFTGRAHMEHAEEETFPNVLHKHCVKPIKNVSGDYEGPIFVCCADFSPDGHYIVIGYSTGLVEVRNPTTGRLANDLKYQALKSFIVTPSKQPALALCFSTSELLAIGDGTGDISVWKLSTGELVQIFEKAHIKKVICIVFHRNGKEILSGGQDGLVKLHGRRSNKTIRDFVGHKSYVYSLAYSRDDNYIVSGGADSVVKIWNAKTAQLLHEYKSPAKVHTIVLMPNLKNDIFLIGHAKGLQLIDLEARPRTKFSDDLETGDSKKAEKSDKEQQDAPRPVNFLSACVSPKGNWIYSVDKQYIYSFSYSTKKVQAKLLANEETSGNDLIGVRHHPFLNLIVTYDIQGNLKLWKP